MRFTTNFIVKYTAMKFVFIVVIQACFSQFAIAGYDSAENQALLAPPVNLSPGSAYAGETRHWQGIPGLERSENGRLWATWYSGGEIIPEFKNAEGPDNYVVLATSHDDGRHWTELKLVIDPPGPVRAFDPVLWHDPSGRLWLFWSQSYGWFDGRLGVWAIVTENSTSETPAWSDPRRLCGGVMMNKPTVLKNGDWLLPVAVWRPESTLNRLGYMHSGSDIDVRSNVYCSKDQGKSWFRRGGAEVPDRNCDEHMIVERCDGSLWMLVRTNYGIGESVSTDSGATWSPGGPSEIEHVVARFFIRRLNSGNLILVKHGKINQKSKGRRDLMAFISEDDGKTWKGGLMLDERAGVSYPDGVQAPDGRIYITYDYNRFTDKEICMAVFTEEDILAGKVVSDNSKLKLLINKAQKSHE